MNKKTPNFLQQLIRNPKRLFLFDALGALLNAILLFGILAQMEQYFGMPSKVLNILSAIVFCFFIYSMACHKFVQSNWKVFLGVIIISNTIYSLISVALIYMHYEMLTRLGITYFILECITVAIVILIECKSFLQLKYEQ